MLDHGNPTTLDRLVQRLFVHVAEGNFLVALFRRGNHRAGIGHHAATKVTVGLVWRRALQLAVLTTLPVVGAAVFHSLVQFHQETAAAERVSLDHLQAGRVRPVQPHFQRILTVRQPVFVLFGAKPRVMIGSGRVV